MMGAERAGTLLFCFVAGTFLAGAATSDAAWLAVSLVPWLLAALCVAELPWRPALSAWAAWLGWSGFCALISPEPWLALVAWWRASSVFLTLALGAAWWDSSRRVAWAYFLAALGLAGAAAAGAARVSFPAPSALASPAGLWAAVGAAAAAGWLSGSDRAKPGFWWLALLGGGACAALASEVPARLALAAAGLWCAAAGERRAAGAAAALLVAVGAAFGLPDWEPAAGWSRAVLVLARHLVSGVGPGLLARELARFGADPAGVGSFALSVAAETGVFGLALFAAAAAASVPAGYRRLDSAGRAAAAGLVALVAFAFLSDVPSSPAFLAVLAATAAAGLYPGRLGVARAADYGTPLRLQRWFTLLGLALALGAWVPRELLRRKIDESARAATPEQKVAALEVAARLAPGDARIHARLAQENLLLRPARVGEALRRIRAAAEGDLVNAMYRAQRSELWAAFGSLQRAAPAAEEALKLEPRFLVPRLILAEAAAAAGDYGAAARLLEDARSGRRAGPSADPRLAYLARWDAEREARIEEALKRAPR